MKWILSRYNHDISYLPSYTKDVVLYDRSDEPVPNSIVVPNIGTDLYDKFTFIVDNYDNLPEVAVYSKANIFKYITEEEFEKIKDNKTFTPILTQNHKTYSDNNGVVCFYDENGMYNERNDYWYLLEHPTKTVNASNELKKMLGLEGKQYLAFAPGSNYILPKENILKHPKEFYEKLRSYLDWAVYPGEAQLIERGLYYLWQ
jgi:hypothetical protein